MKLKRFLAILLAALLLPIGLIRLSDGVSADAEPDVWVQIERYENERLAEQGIEAARADARDFAAMTDGVVRIVENWSGYVPGSLVRNGDHLFWDGVDGTGHGYSPRLRAKLRSESLTGAEPASVSGAETVSYAEKGGSPNSSAVAVFGPYYGLDTSFTNQYKNEGNSIAQATGGVCTVYQVNDATIDNIAKALETCGTVIFDSHGDTDYASGYDYTSRANTSYICLQSGTGITSADQATVQGPYGSYKHAYYAGSGYSGMKYYCVDGTAISNHMKSYAPNSLLWMAICLGMATDGMQAPLREKGVEVVYGYSQSVTFSGDYAWEGYFWNKMKGGSDVQEAIAYMKDKVGYKDPYTNSYPAYPIVVSSEDVYPGQGNVDAKQTVYSSWTLFPQFTVTAVSNDTSLGTVSTSGTTITALPKTGCAVVGYEVISGKATVTQNGDGLSRTLFSVRAETDCTVRIDFAEREPVSATFVTPDGVSCEAISGYTGDTITLPTPSGTPAANAQSYAFYGWVTERVADTGERPDCLYAGDSVVLTEDRVFYALWSYAVQNGTSLPAGTYMKLVTEPADWSGEAVLTYGGSFVLSSNTTASKVGTASAAIAIGETGISVVGDVITNVADAYLYEIESVGNGCYTIRMKGSADRLYLCYNAGSNKLFATNSLIVSGGKCPAYWMLDWQRGNPVFINNQTQTATLCFDTAKQCFTCKKNNSGSALTVYAVSQDSLCYTTELEAGSAPTPVPIDATVEWNADDVQYKGETPYVIANGRAQTPRFTVKNKADGSTVAPQYYDYRYAENTAAGTGYVLITFKGAYLGSASGWFKIYLPATTATYVENVQDGIALTWEPVEGAAGYVIYRRAWSTTTNGWTAFSRWDNTTETHYLDGHDDSHKVYAGTRYQYGVKAYFARRTDPVSGAEIGGNVGDNYNLGEVGPLKTTVRITTRELKEVKSEPNALRVKWAPSKNFTGYQIQYATDELFTENVFAFKITDPKTAETLIEELTSGTTYYVRLRSYHEFEGMTYFGEWSNVLTGIPE